MHGSSMCELKFYYYIKKVTIKEGIVFTPSFAIGFLMSLVWGNIFSLII